MVLVQLLEGEHSHGHGHDHHDHHEHDMHDQDHHEHEEHLSVCSLDPSQMNLTQILNVTCVDGILSVM